MLGALGIFRVAPVYLYSLLGAMRGTKHVIKLHLTDYDYPIFLRVPSSDPMVYRKIFIEKEYDFDVKSEPSVIVDAGANIGLAAVYFANKYPRATVIAIEPEQCNFEILEANVGPYPNIIPMQAALWNENGHVLVSDEGRGEWGFVTNAAGSAVVPSGPRSSAVSAVTLDKLISEYHFSHIDILKVDIEGAEKEVFSDTSLWIDRVESIIIELHERMKAGCNRSFYCGTPNFDEEWTQGENTYLSKNMFLKKIES